MTTPGKRPDWNRRVQDLLVRVPLTATLAGYRTADAAMAARTMGGLGPDSSVVSADAGMRLVYNISSAHLPALLDAVRPEKGYKNRYDLAAARVGGPAPPARGRRALVDRVIAPLAGKQDGESLYYGAVELNGAGIRYFGDLCLVLDPKRISSDTVVLYRNSYDLAREPIVGRILASKPNEWATAAREALEIAGDWSDVPHMAACKTLDGGYAGERRVTTAMVSAAVLTDEDYIEVLRTESFWADDIEEIRLAPAEGAIDARVADRLTFGPAPSLAEIQWRHRRRVAERSAAAHRLRIRVVASQGRTRS
jgi:hypothetical protein